jgi:hypothetical protein
VRVALGSFGAPCVAQRVWAIPQVADVGDASIASSRFRIVPGRLRTFRPSPLRSAMPAES